MAYVTPRNNFSPNSSTNHPDCSQIFSWFSCMAGLSVKFLGFPVLDRVSVFPSFWIPWIFKYRYICKSINIQAKLYLPIFEGILFFTKLFFLTFFRHILTSFSLLRLSPVIIASLEVTPNFTIASVFIGIHLPAFHHSFTNWATSYIYSFKFIISCIIFVLLRLHQPKKASSSYHPYHKELFKFLVTI